MSGKTFSLQDPETGKQLDLPVRSGTMGPDVVDVRSLYGDQGVFTFDPGYASTASCESKITFIDGGQGVLMYRGYPIEQLAQKAEMHSFCQWYNVDCRHSRTSCPK